ncbi:protein UPSTREAM OF FLC isoform X2 [Phoenix dactylifera]|uniref:Protein UPSTREAM OF FLC isoform X2 n=1 Tax=Phoenix dactylifera TaxID=42345 RepID=A0A8B7CVX5_PHODC|nr:protein UPSTREAM OF FLC isoform X2 [Phoenix dactylifera]
MEGRLRKCGGQASPDRSRAWAEPPPPPPKQHQARKIPVVYYLCRNRHLEHPHFIEVPVASPEGLYLRDFINRLNVLRGKGMAAMYSWSCKRSYKNGFVWHDLSEDDLVLPAHGNEYVLKGSELLDQSPSDRIHHGNGNTKLHNSKPTQQENPTFSRIQEASSSSPPTIVIKEAKPPASPPTSRDDEQSPSSHKAGCFGNISPELGPKRPPSWEVDSPSTTEYRVYKLIGAADASTQTDERGGRRARGGPDTCIRGVSTDDGPMDLEFDERRRNHSLHPKDGSEMVRDEISPPPTSSSASSTSGGKTETLESLIKADAGKMNSFRILEEEEVLLPNGPKLRATNVLMQLITCGSISVKDHQSFGLVPTYKPRFSHMRFPSPLFANSMTLGELDCLSENPRHMGLRMEDKEYFSGSLIETKKHKEEVGQGVPILKRSSSYNADRSCKSPDSRRDKEKVVDSSRSKCLPRTIRKTSNKQPKNETMRSPISDGPRNSSAGADTHSSKGGSRRITDTSSLKGSSMRLESFREEKDKVIKIEERLTSGARVIIQSRAPCDDSEEGSV